MILEHTPSISINKLIKPLKLSQEGKRSKQFEIVLRIKGGKQELCGLLSVTANVTKDESFIELSYDSTESLINYRIKLDRIPSSIGDWHLHFFLCPTTERRCRKLYLLVNGVTSVNGLDKPYYKGEIESKKTRYLLRPVRRLLKHQEVINKAREKRSRWYSSKPTKAQKRSLKAICEMQQVNSGRVFAKKLSYDL